MTRGKERKSLLEVVFIHHVVQVGSPFYRPIFIYSQFNLKKKKKGKVCFITIRQQTLTIQGVASVDETKVSKQMVKYITGY